MWCGADQSACGKKLGVKLFRLQAKCKLSNLQTKCVKETFESCLDGQKILFREASKEVLDESGVQCITLHGCDDCNTHVYGPGDNRSRCPECNNPRFTQNGKPKEKVLYLRNNMGEQVNLGDMPGFKEIKEEAQMF